MLKFSVGIADRLDNIVGCIGVIVDANSNLSTMNFYKKFGFVEIEKQKGNTIKMFFKLPTTLKSN
jgi:hypothetical protein